ncbi:MAG: diiron oxygenase, partial [Angustibacter sp.]
PLARQSSLTRKSTPPTNWRSSNPTLAQAIPETSPTSCSCDIVPVGRMAIPGPPPATPRPQCHAKELLMCGIVGLSVGCVSESSCPLSALRRTPSRAEAANQRRSKPGTRSARHRAFDSWDERASVRSTPRHTLTPDAGRDFFPESMVPVLTAHPGARDWDPQIRRAIAIQHLYRYLNFTITLESTIVNPVLLAMFQGSLGVPLDPQSRLNALRMYTDEAFHGLAAFDLRQQVEVASDIPDRSGELAGSALTGGFRRIAESTHQPQARPLLHLVFVIVSESLISGNLRDIAGTQGLARPVSDTLSDHARDESRHHAFFTAYLRDLWTTLSENERRLIGTRIPDMIRVFFAPEEDDVRAELLSYGLPRREVTAALAAAYHEDVVSRSAATASARLLAHLTELGALDSAEIADAFHRAKLLGTTNLNPQPVEVDSPT